MQERVHAHLGHQRRNCAINEPREEVVQTFVMHLRLNSKGSNIEKDSNKGSLFKCCALMLLGRPCSSAVYCSTADNERKVYTSFFTTGEVYALL